MKMIPFNLYEFGGSVVDSLMILCVAINGSIFIMPTKSLEYYFKLSLSICMCFYQHSTLSNR